MVMTFEQLIIRYPEITDEVMDMRYEKQQLGIQIMVISMLFGCMITAGVFSLWLLVM